VGAGFGGLAAARRLRNTAVHVTVVDQRNFHTFQPLLYEVATAGLESGDVAYPIRSMFGKADNIDFHYDAVTGVDWEQRQLLTSSTGGIPFDSLIVASGATAAFFRIPGAHEFSYPLYTLTDARTLRDHVLATLEAADNSPDPDTNGMLNFVVVGGGATGVEVAGALAELKDISRRHDGFRFDITKARIILIDGEERLLTPFKESASSYAAHTLERRGIELWFGRMVKSITSEGLELDDGTTVATQTVVWAGGVTVEGTVAAAIGCPTARGGRLVVNPDLTIPGQHGAYAIGDAAAIPLVAKKAEPSENDPTCPQLAQVAIQSGKHAAEQILRSLKGEELPVFHYFDKGIMATIGRKAAVAQFPKGQVIKGTLGWLSWLGLHLVYLVGFRNKLVVLINWTWRYLSWGSGPRLIVSGARYAPVGDAAEPPGFADPYDPHLRLPPVDPAT
jgi:NADH dehydrogenase